MDQQQIIARYEERAKSSGLTISSLCKEAGLAASTFSRWKHSEKNPKPIGMTYSSMQAIERVLDRHDRTVGKPTPATSGKAA